MPKAIIFIAASILLCGFSQAQVINGEGTYEGSSLHDPPPQTDTAAVPRRDATPPSRPAEDPAAPSVDHR